MALRKWYSLLIAFAAACVPAAADSVYVVTGNSQFGVFDLSDGSFTAVGPGLPEASAGLVAGPNGSLLTLTNSGNLDSINPTSGQVISSIPTGLGSCTAPVSGQCGPFSANNIAQLNGTLYATDYLNNLYRLNPGTGAKTLVGPTGVPPVSPLVPFSMNSQGQINIFGEALVGANGSLYATFFTGTVDPNTFEASPATPDHLYQIDPATGDTVNLDPGSPIPFSLDTIVDVNGTFYTFADAFGDIDTINLANAATTTVGSFDPATTGLIFGAIATPEPTSTTMIAIGLILLLSLRRMRALLPLGRKQAVGTRLKSIGIVSAGLLVIICSPARADTLAITYNLSGTGTVVDATDTTLTLNAQAGGSVLSSDPARNAAWNPVSYSDQAVLDLTTNLLNGSFTLSFADGDTLTGHVFEDDSIIDANPSQTGPFTQTLTFTGGTGEFAGATGSVSGNGFLGTTDFTVSGSGAVNASPTPEPASTTLLLGGLALLIGSLWRRTRNGVS